MQIAPWEIPPDYLGAMRAGAGLGLERARLDTSANEAADRLRLAYTQLADNEDKAAQVAQSRVQQQGAALALKAQQQNAAMDLQRQKADMLDQYRQARLGQFGTEEDRKQSSAEDLSGYRGQRLKQIDAGLDAKKADKIHFGTRGEVLRVGDDGTVEQLRAPDAATARYNGPHTKIEADEFGPEITGPIDHPMIVGRLAKKKAAEDALVTKSKEPGILSRAWNAVTGGTKTPPSAGESLTKSPAVSDLNVLPMPSNKSDLEKGKVYQTKRGAATWDGEQFVQ